MIEQIARLSCLYVRVLLVSIMHQLNIDAGPDFRASSIKVWRFTGSIILGQTDPDISYHHRCVGFSRGSSRGGSLGYGLKGRE
jgi:hypothetical protein